MSNVILTTVFSGFNYGSCLQALAGKVLIKSLGYECQLVAQKSLINGRDIRLKKLLIILVRSIYLRSQSSQKSLQTYQKSYQKKLIDDSSTRFLLFTKAYLKPKYYSWSSLKKAAKNAVACFAGSDQIWNSSTLYVDPLYYLRFAPAYKRVALSPSFGRDFIADYNKKKMADWIGEYPYLSIREDSGVKLIHEMTGKKAVHLLDPTLIISASQWKQVLDIQDKQRNYILAYFLDIPSAEAKKRLQELKQALHCEVVAIPYEFEDMEFCDRTVAAGPKEFVDLIANARVVCTDSFHGTAFAINMHTPFFTFERDYGSANKQSERVLSILRKVNMLERYQPQSPVEILDEIDFDQAEKILAEEREKAYKYVNNAITEIKEHEE